MHFVQIAPPYFSYYDYHLKNRSALGTLCRVIHDHQQLIITCMCIILCVILDTTGTFELYGS